MASSETTYLVQEIVQETIDVRTYRFAYGVSHFTFIPGQFVVARLSAPPGLQGALTLSSSSLDPNEFTLTVKKIGQFGTAFYDRVEIGSLVHLRPPGGLFTLKLEEGRPICAIGRDYAITAARSFFRSLIDRGSPRELILIHEVGSSHEAIFQPEFDRARLARFRYCRVSRPVAPGAPLGPGSQIDAALVARLVPHYASVIFYCAGEGLDVLHFRAQLEALSIGAGNCFFERWS